MIISSNKLLYSLGHYSRKLKCNKAFYKVLSPFFRRSDASDARPLEEFWPDKGSGSICHNNVSEHPSYDLQIVVPCYNVEKYVVECIESILSQQTRFSFKVVIVNDGATDGTRDLLRKYEGIENVTVLDQENRGFGGARNAGFANIDAKYLMFVDSDDVLVAGALEALLSKAFSLEADIVEGGFERFSGSDILYVQAHPDASDNRGISGFPWGKVYKASLFCKLKFPEQYWYEDTFCYMILHYYAKRIATISDIVYRWRKNTSSISFTSKGNLRSIDSLWVTKRLLEDRRTLGLPFDGEFCDFFMHQVRVNFQRTANIGDGDLDKAVFLETVGLWKDYFGKNSAPASDSGLAAALSEQDYGKYRMECLFR